MDFNNELSRRKFLEFLGRASALAAGSSFIPLLSACSSAAKDPTASLPFVPLRFPKVDDLVLAEGFNYSIVLQWQDPINPRERFGFNNDYLAFIPLDAKAKGETVSDGLLWVNHEYPNPVFVSGAGVDPKSKTRDQVLKEMESVGGSIVRIRKSAKTGQWALVPNDKHNRRFTAQTPIPFAWDRPIAGAREGIGTMGNCAGGQTPWRTFLTCEENYQDFWGETVHNADGTTRHNRQDEWLLWSDSFKRPPEHYGWVVEVNPFTGQAKKLISLGRFSHESATVRQGADGRCAVYSGDDANDQCLYKFIADRPGSLERGTLYVANLEQGRWIPLDLEKNETLRGKFKDQTEVLIRAREAADLVGGTKLDRPEDIEVDPKTGAVIVSLTNNKKRGRVHGQLLRVMEKNNDPLATEFEAKTFLAGGTENGFSCPDNLAFDARGNLWMATDISGRDMNKGAQTPFGNNGLFYIPMEGANAGKVLQVASAPNDAEFTGLCFTPDRKTLLVSVQHPGEMTEVVSQPTSHWPGGPGTMPKPAVVAIHGPALDQLLRG